MTPPTTALASPAEILEFPPSPALDMPPSVLATVRDDAPKPYYSSANGDIVLYHGDSVDVLPAAELPGAVDLLFADPPYFLSNGGITCKNGKRAKVDKGSWDRLESIEGMHTFNRRWLAMVQQLLAADGSVFVSGTRHVIFSVGFAMQQLGFKLLNEITWEKPNPPPNLSCRYFTHSTETVIWAARDHRSRHTFNYHLMREENGGKQMKSVWRFTAPGKVEKVHGKHPTQKPLSLLRRIIRATSEEGDLVVDPFVGSGTTAVACAELGRQFVGCDMDEAYLELAAKRINDVNGW
jgi:site-specific DNA-methyltransferase (adenine-specific)